MIKIDKNLLTIPESLVPAYLELFSSKRRVPVSAKNTHERRMEIINQQRYVDKADYNSRYKYNDIKVALKSIYNNKCAYCESKIEQINIEHYRPKKIYYWLSFSWDNLIISCPNCNQYKGSAFEILGKRSTFTNTPENIKNINIISSGCDSEELPKMINPEVSDPNGYIQFHENGAIASLDPRFNYTIQQCKLDRTHLNDERRKLIDVFERDVKSILLQNSGCRNAQKVGIKVLVEKFIRDANDAELPYLAFRRYAIGAHWLNTLVKNNSLSEKSDLV